MTNSTSTEPTDAPLHPTADTVVALAATAAQAICDAEEALMEASIFGGAPASASYDPDAALRAIQTVEAALAEARQLIEFERPEWSR